MLANFYTIDQHERFIIRSQNDVKAALQPGPFPYNLGRAGDTPTNAAGSEYKGMNPLIIW